MNEHPVVFPFMAEQVCPFCRQNVVEFVRTVEPLPLGGVQLQCNNCGARGPAYDSPEDAKDGWNYGIYELGGRVRDLNS